MHSQPPEPRGSGNRLTNIPHWTEEGVVFDDTKPEVVRPQPLNGLSAGDRAQILDSCHAARFC